MPWFVRGLAGWTGGRRRSAGNGHDPAVGARPHMMCRPPSTRHNGGNPTCDVRMRSYWHSFSSEAPPGRRSEPIRSLLRRVRVPTRPQQGLRLSVRGLDGLPRQVGATGGGHHTGPAHCHAQSVGQDQGGPDRTVRHAESYRVRGIMERRPSQRWVPGSGVRKPGRRKRSLRDRQGRHGDVARVIRP